MNLWLSLRIFSRLGEKRINKPSQPLHASLITHHSTDDPVHFPLSVQQEFCLSDLLIPDHRAGSKVFIVNAINKWSYL